MKETRFFYTPNASQATQLPDEEAAHAVKVLRLKTGDSITLMDGCGTYYQAVVVETSQRSCSYRITEVQPQQRQWKPWIHLAIAPTKLMDRMEWLVEKATEIGVDEISFLECQFSERRQLKMQRLDRIAVAAMKQSRKAWKPVLNDMMPFSRFIADHDKGLRFIAHCYDDRQRFNLWHELCTQRASINVNSNLKPQTSNLTPHTSTPTPQTSNLAPQTLNLPPQTSHLDEILVLIGPEGDFSTLEVDMAVNAGFIPADLGKSRLRTETAGLAAVMMMQLGGDMIFEN